MRIAYLASRYPAVSHTFILREVAALRGRGVEIDTFSVRRSRPDEYGGPEDENEAARTRWIVPIRVGSFLSALAWATTRPVRSARVLVKAVTSRDARFAGRLRWLAYFLEAVQLAHWLVKENHTHLHCHFGNSGASTGMLAAELADISFSMTCHGSELLEPERFCLVEKVRRARFVACVSRAGRARLMALCDQRFWDRLIIVRCGVPVDLAEPSSGRLPTAGTDATSRLICVGRLSREKGHLVLLEALAKLKNQGAAIRCQFVGDGPQRPEIEESIDRLQLRDVVSLTGSLTPERVAEALRVSTLFVLGSFAEGVPVVLMEAMAAGVPVVATRVGGVPELIEHGEMGLLVEPGDAAALSAAIQSMIADPERAAAMAVKARRRVMEEFDIEKSAQRLFGIFRSLAPRERGAVPAENRGETLCPPAITDEES